jgi:hypothetical protein
MSSATTPTAKLKRAGVVAELNVCECMSHAQLQDVRITPESEETPTSLGCRRRVETNPATSRPR